MSRVYETKRQRMSSEFPKRSDDPINLSNVEVLLSGIMEDLDTILDEWKDDPPRSPSNRLPSVSSGTHRALNNDAEWLREALGMKNIILNLTKEQNVDKFNYL